MVGGMMGKVLKAKGNAERRGEESLEADEGTRAGCRTAVGPEDEEGTRTGSE